MPTHEEHILRILGEAQEPLYPSEIAERLNRELGPVGAFTAVEIVNRLQALGNQVSQVGEGGWTLKESQQ